MTRNSSTIAFAVLALWLTSAGSAPAQQPANQANASQANASQANASEQEMSFWMKKKLEHSQNILSGVVNGDFEKIVASGESMRALSKVEGFIRGRTPGYRTQLQIFEEATNEIIRQGHKDNLEGAALAFTQLTISCVNCHKQLRDAQ